MKLSLYTFVKNGLYLDFHVVAMLRHHLLLADEIIVGEGYNHFEIQETLASPYGLLGREVLKLMKLG